MSIRRALISVSDKTGIVAFAQQLVKHHIEIIATGGTAALLQEQGIPLTTVSEYTGFPEIMDGRVKTLHPKIYAGLLRRPELDDAVLATHQINPIDLLVVNLYPFQKTIARPNCTVAEAIEHIDIGGPAMLRAAAKNHETVTVVVDPSDYPTLLENIQRQGAPSHHDRRQLARKAFAHTAEYDQAITQYFAQLETDAESIFPARYQPVFEKTMDLRYGENPHQSAALYKTTPAIPYTLATASLLQGKPLSFNNLLDSDAALNCVRALDSRQPGCAIIKHATPCGVAQASSLREAYEQALSADPVSAFGGIIAFNQPLNMETAQAILNQQPFIEVILTPDIHPDALQLLSVKPAWRILACGLVLEKKAALTLRSISGGLLVQQEDQETLNRRQCSVVTTRHPTPAEWRDLDFAWQVVQFVKSNAIVYAKNQTTLGIGGGQTSRVFSAEIAALKAEQAQHSLKGAVAASDAFFPFADGLEIAAQAGICAIIQPGGSKRDAEVIAAADRFGLAMVFTGIRHFRH